MKNRIIQKYKLNQNINYSMLKECHFRNNKLKVDIYNGEIFLIITIEFKNEYDEETENWWTYQVCNNDKINSLYTHYYNREFGKNDVVKKLDRKINKVFSNLVEKNIFIKN